MPSAFGALSVYVEPRMTRIFLLGIISGFPWVLIGSALSRTTIGWAGNRPPCLYRRNDNGWPECVICPGPSA